MIINIVRFFTFLMLAIAVSAVNAEGVRRFNANVDAAATTAWENNWVAHVTGVPASVVLSGSNSDLPFGMPLNRSPEYVASGSAVGHVILSLQSDLLSTSIKNCLLADTAENVSQIRLGVDGSKLGILVDVGDTPVQRFFQSTLNASGCPSVREIALPEPTDTHYFSKLFMAQDGTLSAKKTDGSFVVLDYGLTQTQLIPATSIKMKTYLNNNLNVAASQVLGTTPQVGHGTSSSDSSFFADRIAFDHLGNFGSSGSAFAEEVLTVTTQPEVEVGLMATPGGGYAFQGAASGLDGMFAPRSEALVRVAGAPQDCSPGSIGWQDNGIDSTGHHSFKLIESTFRNTSSNGFKSREGSRWAGLYQLSDSRALLSGLSVAAEEALWGFPGIDVLSAASDNSSVKRRERVNEIIEFWVDEGFIDDWDSAGGVYGAYRFFLRGASGSVISASTETGIKDSLRSKFEPWILSGNPADLTSVSLYLQTSIGDGSDARCGGYRYQEQVEVRDEDVISTQGKAFVETIGNATLKQEDLYFEIDGEGMAWIARFKLLDIFGSDLLTRYAVDCIDNGRTNAKDCASYILGQVKSSHLDSAQCTGWEVTHNDEAGPGPMLGCHPTGINLHEFSPSITTLSTASVDSLTIDNLDMFYGKKNVIEDRYANRCGMNDVASNQYPSFVPNAPTDVGKGFYRTRTSAVTEGNCNKAFGSGELVTYFFAPSSANYKVEVDSVGSGSIRGAQYPSTLDVMNESGAVVPVSSNGTVTLKRGLHALRVTFELSDDALIAAQEREAKVSVRLNSSSEALPLFLSPRVALARDSLEVNGHQVLTNSDQLWDGEYKPRVFIGMKAGAEAAEVTDLRGMGGRFGIQAVYSAGSKLLTVSVDDAQKANPRLRFDLVNGLSSTTADVGVNIDTVGVKTAGLAAKDMLKVWQVHPSVDGGAYVLLSFKRGSLTFKGDQSWGLWADSASTIGTKSKSVGSNDVGETFALLKIDPLLGASWVSDPLRVSKADVSTATITLPGTSNYASIALHVKAGSEDVTLSLPGGQKETVTAGQGGHAQAWINKELGWSAADNEITTLFGQPPYKVDSGVVGMPLNLNIARLDPTDAQSAVISTEEVREAVSLRSSMLFLPTSMPAGSTVENSLIVKQAQDDTFEIIPLRPGQFQLQFQRSANNPLDVLSVIVDSRMPSAANEAEKELLVTHILDAPPVDLDPSLTDANVFVQMAYAQAPGVNDPANAAEYTDLKVFGKLFYHEDPQKLTAESAPAQAVLVYKVDGEWVIRVAQSYRWNNAKVFDKNNRMTAWIGETMSYPGHYAGVQNNIRGYLVGEEGYRAERKSVINLDIVQDSIYATADMEKRSQATSPLYPVADNSRFDEETYEPVDVVWYANSLNVAWPNIAVRYDTRYPSHLVSGTKFSEQPTGTAPSIVIGSQFGSEGFSYAGQADAYDGVDEAAKENAAKAELYFESDLTRSLKVYRQPTRGLAGFNPNEEHALVVEAKNGGGKRKAVFALRNDLNSTGDQAYTSEPFVLVQYEKRSKRTDGTYTDWLPAMRGYHVIADRPALGYTFQIAGTAGQPVAPPYPLEIILPAAQGPYMGESRAEWFDNSKDPKTGTVAPRKFRYGAGKNMAFWQDRNGEFWHAAATPTDTDKIKLNWAYPLQGEFDVPDHLAGGSECVQPQNGVMLWCASGTSEAEVRVVSTHTVNWPEKVSELWAGETATFAGGYASANDTTKTGLPGMVGMASLEVLYDSKNPHNTAFSPTDRKNKFSAAAVPVLSEATQEFSFAAWPDSLKPNTKNTEVDGEKWLFADLAPTFKDRLYYDTQRQKLIFKGRLAGKVLGDKTLTQAPIGPVLLESNVASQELVNQLWDLFEKHSSDTAVLKQAVATLLRKSREPDFKNPALASNLIALSALGSEQGFTDVILKDNWLVGTREVSDTLAVKSAISADVDAMFSSVLGADLLEQLLDHAASEELIDLVKQSPEYSALGGTLMEHMECNGTARYSPMFSVIKSNGRSAGRIAFRKEIAKWLIDDVRLLFNNSSLSETPSVFDGDLDSLKANFDIGFILDEMNKQLHEVEDAECGIKDQIQLEDKLFTHAKNVATERARIISDIRKKISGSGSDVTHQTLLGELEKYWSAQTQTNDGSYDKPQTPVLLAYFKSAVSDAVTKYIAKYTSGTFMSEVLSGSTVTGKSAAWQDAAKTIPFSVALYADPDDSSAIGGVTGLQSNINTWLNTLSPSSDEATYVNKAALGPGIALVSNPEMMKGGADWNQETYLSVVENNDESVTGLPISIHVIKVNPTQLATPALMPLEPGNVFDEKVSLMVSNDFAGNLTDLRFDWRWREDTGSDANRKYLPNVAPLETCDNGKAITTTAGWEKAIPFTDGQEPLGHHTLSITGNSYKALVDNLVYVRYRHKDANQWSSWLGAANHNACHATAPNYEPQLAFGWVKRVVTGLNPFESRMKTITGSADAPASYVSMLQQAGQRYEGPVALNGTDKDVVESLGLIQAYETVLKRAREMSIDRGESVFRESVGTAIQLVSNRLAQLYTLMGNEAYNDSLDGTVPNVDGGVVNLASLYSFKNMIGSPIEEELALLRGKEEIGASPTYNRLLWNYTKGEGEVAYNATYFISDVDTNGLINEYDAGRLYPQGHGDAWGHYLHALDYYYELMIHPNYTWVAMGEGFSLAGQAFDVDYNDEEQFARIAAEKAQVGATVADITFRKLYDPVSSEGLAGYPDDKSSRAWGAVEWAQRATTGAYFDWLTVNSMTPSALPEGYNAVENGVGIIARSAIPEIDTIASSVNGVSVTLNALEAGTNPFGLNDSVVAFDLDTERYKNGDGLFRQTWERANTAVKNAHTIFSAIGDARRAQKEVAQTSEEWQKEIEDKDRAYRDQLIEIFGKPYEGAIGSGKPYPEGYKGPDLQFYNFVDINEVSDETLPQTNAENMKTNFSTQITLTKMGGDRNSSNGTDVNTVSGFVSGITDVEGNAGANEVGFDLVDLANAANGVSPTLTSYDVLLEGKKPDGVKSVAAQAPSDWGERIVKGSLQTAVHDALMAEADLQVALQKYNALVGDSVNMVNALQAEHGVKPQDFTVKNDNLAGERTYDKWIKGLETTKLGIDFVKGSVDTVTAVLKNSADATKALAESENIKTAIGAAAAGIINAVSATDALSKGLETTKTGISIAQHGVTWKYEHVQQDNALNAEYDDLKQGFDRERDAAVRSVAADMNALLGDEPEARVHIFKAQEALAAALDAYRTELDKGLRLLEERGVYNRRIAARIQQLRYKDSTSRVALDALSTKYRRAFDLAQRYVYMAARAYDYETNLKPENALSGASQVANLSKQRLVGRYETQGGEFLPVVGYEGLAETLAVLERNYGVLVSRLGLSVSDLERNVFSLRKEMLSIGKQASNDDRWLDALSEKYRVDDLWTAPEAAPWRTYARTFATRDAGPQPGLVIPFSTKIQAGKNFFGKDLKGGDSAYDPSSAVTRVASMSVILEGYDTQNLSATPRAYIIPVGIDRMIYADSEELEYTGWQVKEKVLPLVFETSAAKVEATNFNPYEDSQQGFVNAIKKFSTMRAYTSDAEAASNGWSGSTRLAGRSVWNDQWLLVIPGQLLLNDADEGLNRLIYGSPDATESVALKDIKLLINSTSVSGN